MQLDFEVMQQKVARGSIHHAALSSKRLKIRRAQTNEQDSTSGQQVQNTTTCYVDHVTYSVSCAVWVFGVHIDGLFDVNRPNVPRAPPLEYWTQTLATRKSSQISPGWTPRHGP